MARIVLVHGFTQTPASWDAVAAALRADGHDVDVPLVPGHGGTPAASMPDAARAAAQALVDQASVDERPATAVWVGYSMGGRLCLHVALDHPSVVTGLVLLGATAGLDDPGERNRRRHADELLARRVESLGVRAFVEEWVAQPLFAGVPASELRADERGSAHDAAGLAGALRLAGTGAQEQLWDRLPDLRDLGIPVLVLAGELDGKFKVLGRRLADALGSVAELAWVPGAGHAAHLERPDAFLTVVRDWLARNA